MKIEDFGLTEKQLEKLLILKSQKEIKPLSLYFEGDNYIFGAIGDTHLCSGEEKLRELVTFYKICQERKVKDIFHAGDIMAGQGIYRGQEFEIHTFGCDNQVNYVIENYPKFKGITTHFIIGNHDYGFHKTIGIDIGCLIANKRKDMNYLGQFSANIEVVPKFKIKLVHPDKSSAYAISYHAQKFVEQILSGKKPNILLMGHAHTNYHFYYRNIAVFGVGCFEGQTSFLLRKGINPVVGGWIISIKINKGTLINLKSEFIPFYEKKR